MSVHTSGRRSVKINTLTPPPRNPQPPPPRRYRRVCSVCGKEQQPGKLVVKEVNFRTVTPNKRLRTRAVAWLCPPCLEKDPAWQQDRYRGSPGAQNSERASDA